MAVTIEDFDKAARELGYSSFDDYWNDSMKQMEYGSRIVQDVFEDFLKILEKRNEENSY